MSTESFLRHLAACSPEQFADDLPIFADWLEEQGHALAERVRTAKPTYPEWTCFTEYGIEPRRYVLGRYVEAYADDQVHFVAVADRLRDGSFRWEIKDDDAGPRLLAGAEPSLRDVDKTVQELLGRLDAAFGLAVMREARSDFQAEVLGWFGWRPEESPPWASSGRTASSCAAQST